MPSEQQHTCRPLLVLADTCFSPSALPTCSRSCDGGRDQNVTTKNNAKDRAEVTLTERHRAATHGLCRQLAKMPQGRHPVMDLREGGARLCKPRYARSAVGPCHNGRARARVSLTVAHGSEEPQGGGPLAQAAWMMQTRGSDCGPDGREGSS